MTMYALERSDGGVSILCMLDPNTTIDKEIAKLEGVLDGVQISSYREIDEAEIPKDRKWRNAWTGLNFDVDIERGKQILIDQFRRVRPEAFQQLDVEFTKALARGQGTTRIEEKRQVLRDLPQMDLSFVKDVTDLDNLWVDKIEIEGL